MALSRQTISATLVGLLVIWVLVLIVGNVMFMTNSQTNEVLFGQPSQRIEELVDRKLVTPVPVPASVSSRPILVALYEPDGMWNTAVWSGWGSDDPKESLLGWAAEGLHVRKHCRVPCTITRDQSKVSEADVIVMEAPNHKLFGHGNKPFPWPSTDPDVPLLNFYFGPNALDPEFKIDEKIRSHFYKTIAPNNQQHDDSVMPISMTCDWLETYKGDSNVKHPGLQSYLGKEKRLEEKEGKLMLYLRNHGSAGQYEGYVNALLGEMQKRAAKHADRYAVINDEGQVPRTTTEGSLSMKDRIAHISKFAFSLVVEYVEEDDWIEMPLSQALAANTVPVYLGAPNIADYVPGPNSYVDIRRDWLDKSPSSLLDHLEAITSKEYKEYFMWKVMSVEIGVEVSNSSNIA